MSKQITDTMIENKVEEIEAQLPECEALLGFELAPYLSDEALWEEAEKQLEASLDDYYDNKYEEEKERRAGIC